MANFLKEKVKNLKKVYFKGLKNAKIQKIGPCRDRFLKSNKYAPKLTSDISPSPSPKIAFFLRKKY